MACRSPSAAAPVETTASLPPSDLRPEAGAACVAHASRADFPPFIAPRGTPEFRAHFAARFDELRCCLTPQRALELQGSQIQIWFVPRDRHDPHAGASAALDEMFDAQRPIESACLDAVLATWVMSHAPVSDLITVDAYGRTESRSASLTVPWRF